MLRCLRSTVKSDNLRDLKGHWKYGLKQGLSDKPLQIYNAYGTNLPITYFYARFLGSLGNIIHTVDLSTDTLLYGNGQYYIDSTKYYDNITPTNVLEDGYYFLEFSNGTEIFKSECFLIDEKTRTGTANEITTVKYFEDDPIFEFDDIES